jgi:hypothetical protein
MQVISFLLLALTISTVSVVSHLGYQATYEDLSIRSHSYTMHSLGYFEQGEVIRLEVIIDEGSVKVLEGREATLHLLDSANKAAIEADEAYIPLRQVVIDPKEESDVGKLEYKAHASDTYYIMYRNEDWWELTLRIADNEALSDQTFIMALWTVLMVTTLVVFTSMYGRLFDVDVRAVLGLVGRPRGPGSRAAREPSEAEADRSDVLE